jgi:hypothetical protein
MALGDKSEAGISALGGFQNMRLGERMIVWSAAVIVAAFDGGGGGGGAGGGDNRFSANTHANFPKALPLTELPIFCAIKTKLLHCNASDFNSCLKFPHDPNPHFRTETRY